MIGRSTVLLIALSTGLSLIGYVSAQTQTFHAASQVKFYKACGDGLDEHSACGNCGYIGSQKSSIAFTKGARCGHVCVKLPPSLGPEDVTVTALAAEDNGGPSFQLCSADGAPGQCKLGWARFEGVEFYKDTHQICGRFKNWSNDRGRVFRIEVRQK